MVNLFIHSHCFIHSSIISTLRNTLYICIGAFLLNSSPALASTSCHTLRSATTPVMPGYGTVFSIFSNAPQTLITGNCTDSSVSVTLGNGASNIYVYKYGYVLTDSGWSAVTFSGSATTGNWVKGTATTSFSVRKNALSQKLLAYFCTKVDKEWKCGCRDTTCASKHWAIQEFKLGTLGPEQIPTIERVEPTEIREGTQVTIYGSGFDPHKNSIISPVFRLDNISSSENGTKITFLFSPKYLVLNLSALESELDDSNEYIPLDGAVEVSHVKYNPDELETLETTIDLPLRVATPQYESRVHNARFTQPLTVE